MPSASRRRFVSACAALALPLPLGAQRSTAAFDLVIRGGIVLDPTQGMQARADVGIRGGRISAIDDLTGAGAAASIDAAGRWVVPGLVDLQVRGYTKQSGIAHAADDYARSDGVTAWASAGDVAAEDLAHFRQESRQRGRTRTYAFVNFDRRTAARDSEGQRLLARMLAEQHDTVLGLTLGFDSTHEPRTLLDAAIELVRLSGTRARILCPLPASTSVDNLLAGLRPGDIVTGIYGSDTALRDDGKVHASLIEARKRGVIVDVGHNRSRFDARTARVAIDQGLLPDIVSSAARIASTTPAPSPRLTEVMSTFLDLGFEPDHVLAMTTSHPARVIGRDAHLGTLALGALADIAVLRIARNAGNRSAIDVVATVRSGTPLRSRA